MHYYYERGCKLLLYNFLGIASDNGTRSNHHAISIYERVTQKKIFFDTLDDDDIDTRPIN